MHNQNITLGEFIIEQQKHHKTSTGEFSRLMTAITLASKRVSNQVNQAGLVDIRGAHGSENIQGEAQQKLDVYANNIFINTLVKRDIVCGIASEENDDFIAVNNTSTGSTNKYILLMDPLDGSSNIDVNVSVGTIFSIYSRISKVGTQVTAEDFLQKGRKQIAAGYVLYGSSTMLIYTTGQGVNGFTLNPALGTFFLSHPDMKIDEKGCIYSLNEGNWNGFSSSIKNYINHCKNQSYTARYIGSLVADVHRNILKGGIYLYPGTENKPKGKLRLLYECNPLAFIIEQAGGEATDGFTNTLDISPEQLHQRCPFYCGGTKMMAQLKDCF